MANSSFTNLPQTFVSLADNDYLAGDDTSDSAVTKRLPASVLKAYIQATVSIPVDDTTALVRDPVDNTKTAGIDAGAVGAGQDRRIVMPDSDVNLTIGTSTGSFTEWLETVTQVEAEAGAATTRRAWTAERVNQAISAAIIDQLKLTAATELTIATGAITITQSYHSVDTESDAASDDLDTISGGTAGQYIILKAADSARTVVVKNGTGNITLQAGADISLDDATDHIALIYDGSAWCDLGGGTGSSAAGGSATQVQYNSGGALAGDTALIWDDSNNRLNIGAIGATADTALHVWGSSAGSVSAPSGTLVTLEDSAPNLAFLSPNTGSQSIYFGDPDDNDVGAIAYDHSANDLTVTVGASQALVINSSQDVLVSTALSAPDSRLHVADGSAGTVTAVGSTVLALENSGTAYLSFLTPNSSASGIIWGDPDDNDIGKIIYDHSDNSLAWTVNAAEALRVLSDGKIGIGIATPDTNLHIWEASAGTVSALAGTLLTLENNSDAYLSFLTPNTAIAIINFGDPEDNDAGWISYDHTVDEMIMRATAGGQVSLQVGTTAVVTGDDNATAGNTRLLIYDVDNATLERVSVGAADSGGSGYKVLRIPN